MKKTRKGKTKEYRFEIDAYAPETMPLLRLTEYLRDLAEMLGEDKSTHLIRIEEGSHCSVILIDAEAEPKIKRRVKEIESGDAPQHALQAYQRLNHRLGEDGATEGAVIVTPRGTNLIEFPGPDLDAVSYGPFNQPGTIDGIPTVVGGSDDLVPVHLTGRGGESYICRATRSIAKQIAPFLFTTIIRAEGVGRWVRHPEGQWEMRSFKISDFEPLGEVEEVSLKRSVEELREISAEWKKLDDPVAELKRIRYGSEV